jgi:hypothetical protein
VNQQDDWALNLRQFLRYLDSSRLPLDQVAPHFGFDSQEAIGIRDRARKVATLRTRNGKMRHRLREFDLEASTELDLEAATTRCMLPRYPSQRFDRYISNRLGARFHTLKSDPQESGLLGPGLQAYVQNVWSTRSYPVFNYCEIRGLDGRSFVCLLKGLEVPLKAIRFISYDPHPRSKWPNKWREALGFSEKIKIKKRKTLFFGREDTRSWLEVRPTFSIPEEHERDGGGVFGFRYAMVAAFILFGPDIRIGDTSG